MTDTTKPAPDAAAPKAADKPLPRLDIRGPVALGVLVVIGFIAFTAGWSALAPLERGAALSGTIIVESKVQSIQHQKGGNVAQVHVVEGSSIKAGDLLVTLDSKQLGDQFKALQEQAAAAERQLKLLRQEAATFAELADRKLTPKSRVMALERQVAEVEKEAAGLKARILVAEQEMQRAEVRAPVGGRILKLAVTGPGAVVAPNTTIIEIVPENDRLVVEGKLAPIHIEQMKPGMPAKVWLATLNWREQRPLTARLAWVSPDSVEDRRTGQAYFVARVEIEQPKSEIARQQALYPGMRADILIVTGERTLLDTLLHPILRNFNRAFRA